MTLKQKANVVWYCSYPYLFWYRSCLNKMVEKEWFNAPNLAKAGLGSKNGFLEWIKHFPDGTEQIEVILA